MITRFAPSPTGPLHIGHAFSAITGFEMARSAGGTFLLRIDDADSARCRQEWQDLLLEDLAWLGLSWPTPLVHQSRSSDTYDAALKTLDAKGLLFPCLCSRADIDLAASAPQEGVPTHGPDGRIYPGTCRDRPMSDQKPGDALRLNMRKALSSLTDLRAYMETGPNDPGSHVFDPDYLSNGVGDVVVSRKSGDVAYHLAVVVDDHAQGVTHVVRGQDLQEATQIHVLLQSLLDLPTPIYHHHRLIRDETGRRLSKREDAKSIRTFRNEGATPKDIRAMIGL